MGSKGDAIWRRDACKTADNMMRVRAYAERNVFLIHLPPGKCYSHARFDHVSSHVPTDGRLIRKSSKYVRSLVKPTPSPCMSKALRPQSPFPPIPYPFKRRNSGTDPT